MRYRLSHLRTVIDVPENPSVEEVRALLKRAEFDVLDVVDPAEAVTGPLVVGRVLAVEELLGFKKPVRFSQVDIGTAEPVGIVCAARNFTVNDLVVVAPPGTTIAGGITVAARKTYGRLSHGMMCSAWELQTGDDHTTIVVLPPSADLVPGTDARGPAGLAEITVELASELPAGG